ncbi:MAG: hypothetical protein V3S41_00945 [Spirochaetia bacterium]
MNSGDGFKEFNVKLSRFQFTPGTIRVSPGDRVVLNLDSVDVQHAFYIDAYGLKTVVPEKGFARLEFVADESGSFRIRCAATCGAFHPFMIGRFVVGSNNVFWFSFAAVFVLPIGVVSIPKKKRRNTDENN